MDVDEREVPIYAGWADSMISIADVIALPIVSFAPSQTNSLTVSQHVRLIRHFPHRKLFVFTLLSSGTVAAMVGFCTSPWQLIALRGLTGLVHFGGFVSVIALGGLVDEGSRNEGQSTRLCMRRNSD
jgi:MFS family permease